ncbi:hypothetical protein [Agrobacterium bohemicum]|uniref:hypothetical protein n=1 Tax=Agrobacterium bohemicum TaxID=2052828 RepID=UPI000A72BD19|nr:hypothetical protein [Agrobacterium bohemicum]
MSYSVKVSVVDLVPNHISSGGFTLMAARYTTLSLQLKRGDEVKMTGISTIQPISRSSEYLNSCNSIAITIPGWHHARSGQEQVRLGRL